MSPFGFAFSVAVLHPNITLSFPTPLFYAIFSAALMSLFISISRCWRFGSCPLSSSFLQSSSMLTSQDSESSPELLSIKDTRDETLRSPSLRNLDNQNLPSSPTDVTHNLLPLCATSRSTSLISPVAFLDQFSHVMQMITPELGNFLRIIVFQF